MKLDIDEIQAAIRQQLVTIAEKLDVDATAIGDDDIIPATGLLDSAGIFELIVWYDTRYGLSLAEPEINIDNLGSIRRMASYAMKNKAAQ
jgi:hypothetical protein